MMMMMMMIIIIIIIIMYDPAQLVTRFSAGPWGSPLTSHLHLTPGVMTA
jgi:hypothetical protein